MSKPKAVFMYDGTLLIDADGLIRKEDLEPPDLTRCPFKVGDRVVLNSEGFQYFNPQGREECKAAVGVLVISHLGQEMCPGVWDAEVEGVLNGYILSTACFDPAPEGLKELK